MSFTKPKGKHMLVISLVAVLFIPFIYSALFALSVWDPYGRVERLPVAFVTEDTGAMQGDKQVNIGAELAAKLKQSKSFKWEFVSAKEAQEGVKNEKYYMALFIPKDFSARSVGLLDSQKKLDIRYLTNQSRDYVADLITSTGAKTIASRLNTEITQKYLEVIFEKLDGFKDKLGTAVDGSGKLLDGSQAMGAGLEKLNGGLNKLVAGEKTMGSKVSFAYGQFGQLTRGLGVLTAKLGEFNAGQTQLGAGIAAAKNGAEQLAANGARLSEGLDKLSGGLSVADSALQEATRKANDPQNDIKLDLLKGGSARVSDSLGQLTAGSGKIADALGKMNAGVPSAAELEAAKKSVQGSSVELSFSEKMKLVRDIKAEAKSLNGNYVKKLASTGAFAKLDKSEQEELLNAIYEVQDENLTATLGTAQRLIGKKIKEKSGAAKERVTKLVDGLSKIRAGLDGGLYDGANKLHAGLTELTNKYTQLDNGVNQLIGTTRDSRTSINKLAGGISQLTAGSQTLTNGFSRYYDGVTKLDAGLGKMAEGSNKLMAGGSLLQGGAAKADAGASHFQSEFFGKLIAGIGTMQDGTVKLHDGSLKLLDGNGKVVDGLTQLHTGLANGKQQLEQSQVSPAAAELLSNPIELTKDTSKADVFGVSSLTYQVPLGLYLAALALMLVYPLVGTDLSASFGVSALGGADAQEAALTAPTAIDVFKRKFGLLAMHAVLTALITGVALQAFLHIPVAQLLPLYTLLVLTALAYVMFIACCTLVLGNVGKFVVLLFFIVQLSVSGGTFPIETTNGIYEFLNKLMPLTYIMKGLNYCLFDSTLSAHLTSALIYTSCMFVTFSGLLYLGYKLAEKREEL